MGDESTIELSTTMIPNVKGSVGYDSLMQVCYIAIDIINKKSLVANGKEHQPKCIVQPWKNEEISGILSGQLPLNTEEDPKNPEDGPEDSAKPVGQSNILSFGDSFVDSMTKILYEKKIGHRSRTEIGLPPRSSNEKSITSTPNIGLGYSTNRWLTPRFTLFDSSSAPNAVACCKLENLEKHIALDYFSDILLFFDPVVNYDGSKLGNIDLLASHLFAVTELFDPDCHLEFMIVEFLLQHVICLPIDTSRSSLVYKLLLHFCRKNNVFPPAVAVGTNLLFQLIPDFDTTVTREFARWFSFHLLNTQMNWPFWDYMVQEYYGADVNFVDEHTYLVRFFCNILVDKISRAAIVEKVKAAIPEPFHVLIPSNNMVANCPHYIKQTEDEKAKGGDAQKHIAGICEKLEAMVTNKADNDEVEEYLSEIVDEDIPGLSEIEGETIKTPQALVCRLFLEALLHIGSTGLGVAECSTIIGLFDDYDELIRLAADCVDYEKIVISTVYTGYSHDVGIFILLTNEMLRRGQVSATACISWLLSSSTMGLGYLHTNPFISEFIDITVDRGLDIAKAAVDLRLSLPQENHTMMSFDMSLDFTPGTTTIQVEATNNSMKGEQDVNDEVDFNEDVMQEVEDPVLVAGESVKVAINVCRLVYTDLKRSIEEVLQREQSSAEDIAKANIAYSIKSKMFRSYKAAEYSLSYNLQELTGNKEAKVLLSEE